ncbi:MAG: ketopantoate reductase family protein [Planctomycetes bacterium]|nr:ketopantoate reductase family protein [Planctomycetota bacterium]
MDAIYVAGAGGIGCAVGYALRAAGTAVTFVDANPAKVEAGRRHGVRVDDRPALSAEFVHFGDWAPRPDVPVLLCTKCYDNAAVLARLPAGANLIPIQNGFDPQLHAFGHAVEGIASFVSECAPDAPHTRITRRGELHVGEREENLPPRPPSLKRKGEKEINHAPPPSEEGVAGGTLGSPSRTGKGVGGLGSSFRVHVVRDISPIKHAKLMYNAAISPLAAAAGLDNGALLSLPEARRLFFELLQENYRILRAAGAGLGKVGPFHPRAVAWILRRKWLAGLMAKFFEPSLRGTYCSMAGEIQKGRTEIDNYNGHLIRLAERAGVPCPLNRSVFDLVVRMTAARERPRREILNELPRPSLRERRSPAAV